MYPSRRIRNVLAQTMFLAVAAVIVGCDALPVTPLPPGGGGSPQPNPTGQDPGAFEKGSVIFSLKTDPIQGFTWTRSGAIMEHWVYQPPMTQGRLFAAGVALNNRIYAIGGNTFATPALDSVEMLDLPGTGVWTPVAKLSAPRTGIAAAAVNGKIYAIGGFQPGAPVVGTNEEYDPALNIWTPRAPNPTPRSYARAVTVKDKIYVIGGSAIVNNVFTDSPLVDEYDPATNAWTPKAPMPVGLSTHAAAELNGKIHVVSGSVHLEFDPVANSWTPRKPMPTFRDRLGAFSWNGKLFAVGGRTSGGGVTGIVEEYVPEFDGWNPRQAVLPPNTREAFGYASIGPSFYRLGGIAPTGQGGNDHDRQAMEYFAFTPVFPFIKD